MILYVESNFVLEIALGQRDSAAADRLLEAAEDGSIEIALPAFSLIEPFATPKKHRGDRNDL